MTCRALPLEKILGEHYCPKLFQAAYLSKLFGKPYASTWRKDVFSKDAFSGVPDNPD
jgi:hypothetical protein